MLAFASLFISGCLTTSAYHPFTRSSGFSDTVVAPGEFEVGYVGRTTTSATDAKQYAYLRAAELTLLNDARYFEILSMESSTKTRTQHIAASRQVRSEEKVKKSEDGRKKIISREYTVDETPARTIITEVPVYQLTIRTHSGDSAIPDTDNPATGRDGRFLDPFLYIDQALRKEIPLSPDVQNILAGMPKYEGLVSPVEP